MEEHMKFPYWKVLVTVEGSIVATRYEVGSTSTAAIAKAKHKLRGASSSAGAFKFKAKLAGPNHFGHKGGECDRCDGADEMIGREL